MQFRSELVGDGENCWWRLVDKAEATHRLTDSPTRQSPAPPAHQPTQPPAHRRGRCAVLRCPLANLHVTICPRSEERLRQLGDLPVWIRGPARPVAAPPSAPPPRSSAPSFRHVEIPRRGFSNPTSAFESSRGDSPRGGARQARTASQASDPDGLATRPLGRPAATKPYAAKAPYSGCPNRMQMQQHPGFGMLARQLHSVRCQLRPSQHQPRARPRDPSTRQCHLFDNI